MLKTKEAFFFFQFAKEIYSEQKLRKKKGAHLFLLAGLYHFINGVLGRYS